MGRTAHPEFKGKASSDIIDWHHGMAWSAKLMAKLNLWDKMQLTKEESTDHRASHGSPRKRPVPRILEIILIESV